MNPRYPLYLIELAKRDIALVSWAGLAVSALIGWIMLDYIPAKWSGPLRSIYEVAGVLLYVYVLLSSLYNAVSLDLYF